MHGKLDTLGQIFLLMKIGIHCVLMFYICSASILEHDQTQPPAPLVRSPNLSHSLCLLRRFVIRRKLETVRFANSSMVRIQVINVISCRIGHYILWAPSYSSSLFYLCAVSCFSINTVWICGVLALRIKFIKGDNLLIVTVSLLAPIRAVRSTWVPNLMFVVIMVSVCKFLYPNTMQTDRYCFL